MKKMFCIILALLLALSASAVAESITTVPEVKMLVNGTRLVLIDDNNNVLPIISSDGTMYVPVKEFVESIGGTYDYDVDTSTINISLNSAAETKTSTKQVELTKENFLDYFSASIERSNFKCEHSNTSPFGAKGFPWNYFSEDLTLHVDANAPFEIHNVKFSIEQKGTHGTGSNVTTEPYKFDGVMPQNGSYSSTVNVTWNNGLYDNDYLILDENIKIKSVEGYIVIPE